MIKAIAVFWLSLTHFLGLCKPFHRKDTDKLLYWQSVCPIIDRIITYLFPNIKIRDEA